MTFSQAFHVCFLKKYCDFKGRASRSEFWWFSMSVVGISTISNLIFQYILSPQIMVWASLTVSLIFMLPNLAVTVRRLHDRNLRGWWLLAPIAASLMGQPQQTSTTALITGMLMLSMCLCFLVILALPGSTGDNRFGPDPLGQTPSAEDQD